MYGDVEDKGPNKVYVQAREWRVATGAYLTCFTAALLVQSVREGERVARSYRCVLYLLYCCFTSTKRTCRLESGA